MKWKRFFLDFLRSAPNHAALSFRYAPLGAHNSAYTVQASARPSPIFASATLRQTSYMQKRYATWLDTHIAYHSKGSSEKRIVI